MSIGKARSNERGAILVEMAFALPILAIIFLNIIDLGLMVRQYQVLQNAAREAARFSSMPKFQMSVNGDPAGTLAAIKQVAITYAAQEKITINDGEITVNQTYLLTGGCGSEITITYTRPMLLLGAPFLPRSTLTLTGRAVFHNLYGC